MLKKKGIRKKLGFTWNSQRDKFLFQFKILVEDEWMNGTQSIRNSEFEWPTQEPSIPQLLQLEIKAKSLQLA